MSGDPEDFEDPIKSAFTPAAKLRASDQREAGIMDMMAKMQHEFQRQLQELEERQMFLQMENDTLREMTSNQPNQTNQNPTNPKTTIKTEKPDQAQDQPTPNQDEPNPDQPDADDDGFLSDDDDAGFLTESDDHTSQAWRDANPVAALDALISVPSLTSLSMTIERKWRTNVGSLMTFIREHYKADIAAMDAALQNGSGLTAAVNTFTGHISLLFKGDSALLVPVALSHAVLARTGTPTPFSTKAAECVTHTWRAYMRSAPSEVRSLLQHTQAGTVPQHLKAPGPTWTGPQAHRLDPAQYDKYQKAYLTVLTLLKAALTATAATHHTPQALRNAWAASFTKSDDVSYILAQQAPHYEALLSRTGHNVDKEERNRRLRACFSPALLHEHNKMMARAGLDATCVPWDDCVDNAMKAAAYLQVRKTHEAPDLPPPTAALPVAVARTGLRTAPAATDGVVFPAQDPAWVESNKSNLISYGMCSRTMINGVCDRDPGTCSFQHQLPDHIDTNSEKWQRAEEKSAAYHARRKANAKEREATAAPALAAPAEPSFATQMAQMMAALSAQEDQDTATAAKSARPSAATFPVVRYDENDDELDDDELPPTLYQPRPENFPANATSCNTLAEHSELPPGKMYSHLTGEVIDEDWDDGSYDWVEDPDNYYGILGRRPSE